MKTVKLTAEEIRWLKEFLWRNPCRGGCILDKYPAYDCYDKRKDGKYKCPMKRSQESIFEKIYSEVVR